MITVTPTQYIYPPRAENCIPRDQATAFLELGWKPQLKYNDTRIIIKIKPEGNELWNRHGEKLRTYTTPEHLNQQITQLATKLNLDPQEYHLLDGGLLDQKHKAIKDTIVIWDILVQNSQHLLGTTYQERYNKLLLPELPNYEYKHPSHQPIDFGYQMSESIILAKQYETKDWDYLWEVVQTVNQPYTIGKPKDKNYSIQPVLEGVVIKDPNGKLEMGYKEKNNTDWMVKSRVHTGRHRF